MTFKDICMNQESSQQIPSLGVSANDALVGRQVTLEQKTLDLFIGGSIVKQVTTSLVCAFALFLEIQPAFAHGTVTSPPSRIWRCYQEGPESPDSPACTDAVALYGTQALYDWNEINQAAANGNHQAIIPDGTLASGGRPQKYGGMDQVRADWTAEQVSPGPYTIGRIRLLTPPLTLTFTSRTLTGIRQNH